MLAVVLSLAAAMCWGGADFGGGWFSRRYEVPAVLFIVEVGGMAGALIVVIGFAHSWPDGHTMVMGALAGSAGMGGLGLFYRALSVGEMSVVAPISSTGAVIPVVVGLLTGDDLTAVIATGLAIAFAGVLFAAQEAQHSPGGDEQTGAAAGVWPALGAAVGFGLFFLFYKSAAEHSEAWTILIARLPAIPLVGGIVLARSAKLPRGTDLKRLVGLGQVDVAAGVLYAIAITRGALSIVAVVGSLYPVVTILLARAFLGERLRTVQVIGVGAALAGVALVGAGSA